MLAKSGAARTVLTDFYIYICYEYERFIVLICKKRFTIYFLPLTSSTDSDQSSAENHRDSKKKYLTDTGVVATMRSVSRKKPVP